jgi:hypothetical protein
MTQTIILRQPHRAALFPRHAVLVVGAALVFALVTAASGLRLEGRILPSSRPAHATAGMSPAVGEYPLVTPPVDDPYEVRGNRRPDPLEVTPEFRVFQTAAQRTVP